MVRRCYVRQRRVLLVVGYYRLQYLSMLAGRVSGNILLFRFPLLGFFRPRSNAQWLYTNSVLSMAIKMNSILSAAILATKEYEGIVWILDRCEVHIC